MGRWRSKDYKKRQMEEQQSTLSTQTCDQPSNNTESSSSCKSEIRIPGWDRKDRITILRYLKDYKDGCECAYHGGMPICQNDPVIVGIVQLPLLTLETFHQPYLAFPTVLSSKQRKMIHQCCTEAFLFHISAGGERHTNEERAICISVYVDGFEQLSDIDPYYKLQIKSSPVGDMQVFHHPPIHQFRPWYALKNRPWLIDAPRTKGQQNMSLDEAGKKLTGFLFDNPEIALREDLDVMDFEKWDGINLSNFPVSSSSSSGWTLVDTPGKMHDCIQKLRESRPTEIGFDLESYNMSKYSQLTCLLQITSNAGHDYIIDVLAPGVWDLVGPGLAPLFADKDIVKIGHSIGGLDVRSLHRDFGIFVVNAFDTYEAAKVLGLDSHGLAAVCDHYGMTESKLYKDLKAKYQASDWRLRPLTEPQLTYGRFDVRYLLQLRILMIRDLTRSELFDRTPAEANEEALLVASSMASTLAQLRDDEDEEDWTVTSNHDSEMKIKTTSPTKEIFVTENEQVEDDFNYDGPSNTKASVALLRMQPDLMKVISKSQDRCRDLWCGKAEPFKGHPLYSNITYRARSDKEEEVAVPWDMGNDELYEKIIDWRNRVASELEILPGFVAPLDFLIAVALQRPRSEQALRRVSYHLPELFEGKKKYLASLLHLVQQSSSEVEKEVFLYYSRKKRARSIQGISSDQRIEMVALFLVAAGSLVLATIRWKKR